MTDRAGIAAAAYGRLAIMVVGAPEEAVAGTVLLLRRAGAGAPAADRDGAPGALARRLAMRAQRDPFAEPPALTPERLSEARRLLASGFEEGDPVVLAPPPGEAPLWARALGDAGFGTAWLLVVGPASSVDAEPAAAAREVRRWAASLVSAERATQGARRAVADAEALQRDPRPGLERIARRLGVEWSSRSERLAVPAFTKPVSRVTQDLLATPGFAAARRLGEALRAEWDGRTPNTDAVAEAAEWLAGLPGTVGPAVAPEGAPASPLDRAAPAEKAALEARARAAEARAEVTAAALAAARRRHAEAEALLQARATEAVRDAQAARAEIGEVQAAAEAAQAALLERERELDDVRAAAAEQNRLSEARHLEQVRLFADEDARLRERLLEAAVLSEIALGAVKRLTLERDAARRELARNNRSLLKRLLRR